MAHPHSSPHAGHDLPAAPSSAESSAEQATLIGTLAHLWPSIWPSDRSDLKMRVVWSFVLLLIAKLATLAVPFTFKWATDALTGKGSAPVLARIETATGHGMGKPTALVAAEWTDWLAFAAEHTGLAVAEFSAS